MRTRTVRRRWVALAATFAITSAACGSTVQQTGRQAVGAAAGAESGLGNESTNGGAAGTNQSSADATGTATGATGSGGVNGSGRTPGAPGTRVGAPGDALAVNPQTGNGPGVDAKTISVGAGFAVNSAAANAAIGANGITQGDLKAEQQVLIDDINAHGGVAGRKLVPVWHQYDNTSADSADVQEQSACDDYTQDHKTFAVLDGGRDTFLTCIEKRGSLSVSSPLSIADTSTFSRYPHYVEVSSLNLDRSAAALPGALAAEGWAGGWDAALAQPRPAKAKVGIVTYDYTTFSHAVDQILVPGLAKVGLAPDPADIRKVIWLQSNADVGSVAAGISSAVLKFRQDGVDHVIVFDERGVLTLLFLNNAESQHFFPRYGWTSQNGPQAFADQNDVQPDQLVGSMGIGWLPQLDITPSHNLDNGPYSNDARRRCVALYRAHGVTFADTNAEAGALDLCTQYWFLQLVLNSMGTGPITRDRFMATVNKVGATFQGAGDLALKFSPTKHDGVSAYRYYQYDAGCSCMEYKSGNIDAP